jgi:hypothetical protein
LDADDYQTYLDHPEVGVPEKNPNRVVGGKKAAATRGNEVHGDPKVGPFAGGNTRGNTRDPSQKDPVRVEAGKKAARSRGFHVRDDDEQENENENQSENEEMEDEDEDERRGSQEENEQNENQQQSKNPNRVRGGKKAARTKGQHVHGDDDENDEDQGKDPTRVQAGKKAASHFSHEHFVELGKKGAEARIQKYHQNRRGGSQDQNFESENESENEGESRRQNGGSRRENEGGSRRENEGGSRRENEGESNRGHQVKYPRRAEAGRKGAAAVISKYGFNRRAPSGGGGGAIQRSSSSSPTYRGRSRGNSSRSAESENEEDDYDYFEDPSERPPRRRGSSGGSSSRRGGGRGRGGGRPDDEDVSDEDYDDSRGSRESIYTHSGFPLSVAGTRDDGRSGARVRGGQLAAIKTGRHVERGEEEMASKNPKRIRGGQSAASRRSHEDFVEMGRKGGRSRWYGQTEDDDQSMEEGEENQGEEQQKNPNRVRGGKKSGSNERSTCPR